MEKYMGDLLDTVDGILLGRVAYQLLADYWPSFTENLAPRLNNLPKIVFSKTLEKVEWKNSRLVKENIKDEISKMDQECTHNTQNWITGCFDRCCPVILCSS